MRTLQTIVAVLTCALFFFATADAADSHPICRVLQVQEQIEREDLLLDVELAESNLVAHEEIFALLEGLWKNDVLERLIYLDGKHDRDIAKLRRDLRVLLVKRQDALIEQFRLLCDSNDSQQNYDRALERYLKDECERLAKQAEIARVDLDFALVQEESVLDLREHSVATRQDVILAQLEVANARQRLADGERRVRSCSASAEQP